MEADAASLPFMDGSFDVVVSRFALHHFEDPAVQMAEMRRARRPGGRLAVSPTSYAIPTQRSPPPRTAWSAAATRRTRGCWRSTSWPISSAAPTSSSVTPSARSSRGWLSRARRRRAAAEIRLALQADLDGGAPTGFRPRDVDGDARFLHTMASVIAAGTLAPGP